MAFRVTINKKHCKGCALCIEVCPRKLLRFSQTYNQQGLPIAEFIEGDCTGCRRCALICPDAAIEIEKIDDHDPKSKKRGSSKRRGTRAHKRQ